MRTYEELEQLFGDGEQAFLVTTFPFSEEAALLYCNDAASVFFGESREKITGRTLGELGEAWKKDKEIHHSVFDGDMCLCMIIDVADSRRRLEKEYQAYRKRMEEALEAANVASLAKTKFLSEMSHDIRTPMNAIMGMADIALNYAEDSGRVEDCLKKIQTASGHLLRLINEVLDMSRIESGKLVLVNEPFRLADLVHEIFIVIRPQAEKKNIGFHLELGDILHEELVGDRMRIQQIYINLLSNAIKYTQEGGAVWMNLCQRETAGKSSLFLEVRDNGIGMSEEFVKHIFDPFERERNTTFSGIEGTGLGMSITKKLVDMMQGHIVVESKKGEGSTFRVDFPLEVRERERTLEKSVLEGKRVLVLQGAVEKLTKLPEILGRLGMESDTAACGMEAIDLINEADIEGKDYFALLTGDRLEDVELSLLLQEIRARKGRDFPMLLLSESDWSEVEYLLQQAGITTFVPLPLFESRLAEALYGCTKEGKREQEQKEKKAERHFENSRVLLVEDNELNLEIAVEILGSTGAQIDTAGNGQEALDAFAAKPEFYYDLILMDIQMPVMDGLEATRRIRGLNRQDASRVHIVAMTANAFVEDRRLSVEAGMNAHITKPLDVEQVLECLDKWGRR